MILADILRCRELGNLPPPVKVWRSDGMLHAELMGDDPTWQEWGRLRNRLERHWLIRWLPAGLRKLVIG